MWHFWKWNKSKDYRKKSFVGLLCVRFSNTKKKIEREREREGKKKEKKEAPRPGLEPGSPGWQPGILTTYTIWDGPIIEICRITLVLSKSNSATSHQPRQVGYFQIICGAILPFRHSFCQINSINLYLWNSSTREMDIYLLFNLQKQEIFVSINYFLCK